MKRLLSLAWCAFLPVTPLIAAPPDHATAIAPAPKAVDDRALPPALRCTPLEAALRRNGRRIPRNDADWQSLFERIDGTGPDIYFSTSNSHADLLNPRRIFTARSNLKSQPADEAFYGRLFVAVGRNQDGDRVAEFITQDARSGHYLFGTIDPTRQPVVRIDALNDCKECHKTLGPLYTIYPWTHSSANLGNQLALLRLLAAREGDPYRSALSELDAILADVRQQLAPKELAALRRVGNINTVNQFDDGTEVIKAVTRRLVERIEASGKLRELKYQGVPVFRNPGTTTGVDKFYSHDFSGAHELHEIVSKTHSANRFAQDFQHLPKEKRARFLDTLATISITKTEGKFDWGGDWAPVPGAHSNLTSDPGVGAGNNTTIHSVDNFFTSLILDQDGPVKPILERQERLSRARVAEMPELIGLDPRNSAHYDVRGQGESFSEEKGEHSLLGITNRMRAYLKSVIESRKGNVDEALTYALGARWMKELNAKGAIPHPAQGKTAVMKGLGEYFLVKHKDDSVLSIPPSAYLSDLETECLKYLDQPQTPGEACVRCHGSQSYHYRYLNDFARWEKDLKSGEKDARALVTYLKKGNPMPPADTPERFSFADSANAKSLRAFLDRH